MIVRVTSLRCSVLMQIILELSKSNEKLEVSIAVLQCLLAVPLYSCWRGLPGMTSRHPLRGSG